MAGKILIVDDEPDMLLLLKRIISEGTDHEPVTERKPARALEIFKAQPFDLVITDLKMPHMDGIRLLEQLKKIRPNVSVVVMTAYGTIENAVEATQKGAFDYITKPFRRERILLIVKKAMKWQEIVGENQALRQALADRNGISFMVGSTPAMKDIFERVRMVAPTMATILITGSSGTGKELIARAIHRHSQRHKRQMVTINCTAIPEHVLESELFGHVKGAFTGAWKDKKGLVEKAHEGTLFLDEVADLKPVLQTKLLRLLQEGEYKPVGSEITREADIRFIAATNHDLKVDIAAKQFREDLYYRLNVIRIDLPSLRDRKEDIPLLSHHFLEKYARIYSKEVREISAPALQALMLYEFPGNVRELENTIERGVIFCRSHTLNLRDLSLADEQKPFFGEMDQDVSDLSFKEAKGRMIRTFHKHYIQALLARSGGNISRAADAARIKRQYLHRLMKNAGIQAEDFKSKPDLTDHGRNL